MSSSSRRRPDRRAARAPAALLLTALLVLCHGPLPAAAAIPLPVIAVLPGAERTSLVVDLGAGAARTATVTVDGAPLRAELTPVVSDRLAVALVVDASDAGAAALPAWLSAAARFILEVPAGTLASAIADTSPPAVLAPPRRGPAGVVRALSSVRAAGRRSTSSALTLAMRQFPATATGPRVVVVYTTSPDAGGENAAALGARLARAGTILVVVGTAGGGTYWADAARATGGFFAPAGTPVVVPALDQVETTLRGRHLVRFATPRSLPAHVSVRIDTGGLSLTGGALVTADPGPAAAVLPPDRTPGTTSGAWWWTIVGCVTLLAAAALILPYRRRRPRPVLQAGTPTVARGRASVPHAPAGREPPATP
ncbi:VWA domain-containing protein [Actinoplanes sp. NPDC049118]|uniref:vWA domain-containing protein n=1 Tax=Actinoplanes sp. NPDC049118 TaxID=3155769 RepID=UPI0033F7D573